MTVVVNNTKEIITTVELAELIGKPHNDLLKAIRKMESAWEKVSEGRFSLISYKDSMNRTKKMYELTKTESLYIATKFNDEARAKVILRWEELELEKQQRENPPVDFNNPETVLQIVQNWAADRKKLEAAEQKIDKLQPKADFADRIIDDGRLLSMSQAAKLLKKEGVFSMGRTTLYKRLREDGIFFKNGREPKQYYIDRGYFVMKEKYIEPRKMFVLVVLVTQKGLKFLAEHFTGNLPIAS